MVISFLQRHPKIAAGHIRAEDNLGAMLLEILELYGTRFNFDKVGIAIDHGGSYFRKADYEYSDTKIWKKICMRDPNDPLNNISKASFQTENIIKVFGDAYRNLATRCCLVHAQIQKRKPPPWGTKCGSLLDSIIERPSVAVRERLQSAWRPSMSEGFDLEGVSPEDLEDLVPKPQKRARPKKSAKKAKKLAKSEARKKEESGESRSGDQAKRDGDEREPPARRRKSATRAQSPKKKEKRKAASKKPPKSPTKTTRAPPLNDSSGTKDTPIVLDSPSSSPRLAPSVPQPSPTRRKRKNGSAMAGDVAAANLTASGSISGIPRDIIALD